MPPTNSTTHYLLVAILGALFAALMPELRFVGYVMLVIGASTALARMVKIEIEEFKRIVRKS